MLDTIQFVAESDWRMAIQNMISKPSAFLPVVMSFAALAVVLFHVAIFGAAREADEGTAAHPTAHGLSVADSHILWHQVATAQSKTGSDRDGTPGERRRCSDCTGLLSQPLANALLCRSDSLAATCCG